MPTLRPKSFRGVVHAEDFEGDSVFHERWQARIQRSLSHRHWQQLLGSCRGMWTSPVLLCALRGTPIHHHTSDIRCRQQQPSRYLAGILFCSAPRHPFCINTCMAAAAFNVDLCLYSQSISLKQGTRASWNRMCLWLTLCHAPLRSQDDNLHFSSREMEYCASHLEEGLAQAVQVVALCLSCSPEELRPLLPAEHDPPCISQASLENVKFLDDTAAQSQSPAQVCNSVHPVLFNHRFSYNLDPLSPRPPPELSHHASGRVFLLFELMVHPRVEDSYLQVECVFRILAMTAFLSADLMPSAPQSKWKQMSPRGMRRTIQQPGGSSSCHWGSDKSSRLHLTESASATKTQQLCECPDFMGSYM